MSVPNYTYWQEADPNLTFRGKGLHHNKELAHYKFSVQPDWYFEYESDLHLIDLDNTTGSPQTLSITLPKISSLQYSSRIWFVYYKKMNAGDTLELYTLAGSGNTINETASPFVFGPFVNDIEAGVAVCIANDTNYIFRFQKAPSYVGAPMVRFASSSTYDAPDVNQYAVITQTGWQLTGNAAAYIDSRVDVVVPITGGEEVIHPGMDGYMVKTNYTDSDMNVVDAYQCTQSGYYRISPNFQTRYQYAQTGGTDITVTPLECWFKKGDVDNNPMTSVYPLHKMPISAQPMRELGSATVTDGEIFGNLATSFVAHLDAGEEYYFAFMNIMLEPTVPDYTNFFTFGDVFFELVKIDDVMMMMGGGMMLDQKIGAPPPPPTPLLSSFSSVSKNPPQRSLSSFSSSSSSSSSNAFKGAPIRSSNSSSPSAVSLFTSKGGQVDPIRLADIERVFSLMLEKNNELIQKNEFDKKQNITKNQQLNVSVAAANVNITKHHQLKKNPQSSNLPQQLFQGKKKKSSKGKEDDEESCFISNRF